MQDVHDAPVLPTCMAMRRKSTMYPTKRKPTVQSLTRPANQEARTAQRYVEVTQWSHDCHMIS